MESESNQAESEQCENVYNYQVGEGQSLSEGVIRAVASVLERKPTPDGKTDVADGHEALEPLYDTIDPDALDALFQTRKETRQPSGEVEFMYSGCAVTVKRTGVVTAIKRQ